MKTKKEATLVARFWNNHVWNGSEYTATIAKVRQLTEEYFQVEIHPAKKNDGKRFSRVNELGGIESAWNLHTYIVMDEGKLIGIIS